MNKYFLAVAILTCATPAFAAEGVVPAIANATATTQTTEASDEPVEAGGLCASNYDLCLDTARSIMLLNNENVSVQSSCQGYDTTRCKPGFWYYIATKIRQLK